MVDEKRLFYNLLFVAQGFLNNITEICKHNMMDTEITKYYITSELLNIRFDDMLLLLGSPSRIGQRRRSVAAVIRNYVSDLVFWSR